MVEVAAASRFLDARPLRAVLVCYFGSACQFFYACSSCDTRLRPKDGDCCVFCSYADVPCPPKQAG